MQSINEEQQHMSTKDIASTARQREGMRPTLKAAMKAWAESGIFVLLFVLLFLASMAYAVFGGQPALEASPAPGMEISMAEPLIITADAGEAARAKIPSGSFTAPANYFPSGYVNAGRDGDGNVMTYEHD
jgi:hypothetical protein